MDKERLERIGKFLNDRLIIHRNVENNTPWTTEEKMIQELYDNYLDILIKYKKQKEVIDKAIKIIEDTYYSKNTTDIDSIVLSSDKLIKVRKILKEVE